MVGKAIGNLIQDRNMATRTIALSSILFLFSDLMLVLAWFVKKLYWAENLSLTAYYPALSFLAFSMLLMALYKNNFNFKQSNA